MDTFVWTTFSDLKADSGRVLNGQSECIKVFIQATILRMNLMIMPMMRAQRIHAKISNGIAPNGVHMIGISRGVVVFD
jgi:hypothetical protein